MEQSRVIIDFNPGFRNYISHSPYLNLLEIGDAAMDRDVLVGLPGPGLFLAGDCLLIDHARPASLPPWVLTVYIANDSHRFSQAEADDLERNLDLHTVVASPYRHAVLPDALPHTPPTAQSRWVAMPHSVPAAPPLPREASESTRGFAVATRHPRPYPAMTAISEMLLPCMTRQSHPGHQSHSAMRAARDAWWSTLAAHHIGIVGLGWGPRGYVLAKYVEYLYAGLLLLAERPGPEDCELLGLRHMENCILFDWPREKDFFVATYERAIRDFTPFAPIAAAGQRLALRRHTARSRLDYLRRVAAYFRELGRVPDHDQQLAFMAYCELS